MTDTLVNVTSVGGIVTVLDMAKNAPLCLASVERHGPLIRFIEGGESTAIKSDDVPAGAYSAVPAFYAPDGLIVQEAGFDLSIKTGLDAVKAIDAAEPQQEKTTTLAYNKSIPHSDMDYSMLPYSFIDGATPYLVIEEPTCSTSQWARLYGVNIRRSRVNTNNHRPVGVFNLIGGVFGKEVIIEATPLNGGQGFSRINALVYDEENNCIRVRFRIGKRGFFKAGSYPLVMKTNRYRFHGNSADLTSWKNMIKRWEDLSR